MLKTWFPSATAIVALAAGLPAEEAMSIEKRLQALERKVEDLSRENDRLRTQLGAIRGEAHESVGAVASGRERTLEVGGFIQGQGEFGGAADSRWNGVRDRVFLRRARLHVAGTFAEEFDFKAEVELQGNSAGSGGGRAVRANDVFVNWHRFDFANLRLGQFKPAFGAEQLLSDTKIPTVERSLATDRLTDGRQMAIGAAGKALDGRFTYLAVVANGNGTNVASNDNDRFAKSARITFAPLSIADHRLVFGVSGLWSTDAGISKSDLGLPGNSFTGSRRMESADVQWTHGPLAVSAEWLRGHFRPSPAIPASRFTAEGWHGTIVWDLIPGTLQAVFRHEEFDPDTATPGNSGRTNTFGLNYLILGDDLKLGVNYLDGHTPEPTDDARRLLTRVQVIF